MTHFRKLLVPVDFVAVNQGGPVRICEHHMLPFFGRRHVAYLPYSKIIGSSR